MAGENREPEYTAMQPLKTVAPKKKTKNKKISLNSFQVPLVVDGDFFVRDSLAAVGYLAARFEVEDHWYPKVEFEDFFLIFRFYSKKLVSCVCVPGACLEGQG